MRATSPRRTARHGRGRAYHGSGMPTKATKGRDVTVPDDDPEGIVCVAEGCGARVKRLANGRPAAHAKGGTYPRSSRGEYKCEGSGRE